MWEPCVSCNSGVGWLRQTNCLHLCTFSIIRGGTGIQHGCEHSPLHTVVIQDFFIVFQLKKQWMVLFAGCFFFILSAPIFSQQYAPSSPSLFLWQRKRADQASTVPAVWGVIGQAPNITNHKNWVVDIPQIEVAAVALWGVTAGLCSYSLH